jgi:hypothetical protein
LIAKQHIDGFTERDRKPRVPFRRLIGWVGIPICLAQVVLRLSMTLFATNEADAVADITEAIITGVASLATILFVTHPTRSTGFLRTDKRNQLFPSASEHTAVGVRIFRHE